LDLWSPPVAERLPIAADLRVVSAPPRRSHLIALLAVYVFLMTYGSLVPCEFHSMQSELVAQRINAVLHEHVSFRFRSDLLVNVMIAIPLAFLLMGALCVDRGRMAAMLAGPLVVVTCVLFGAGLEVLQLFFPPRVMSLSDVVFQTLGSCLGVVAWLIAGQATVGWCRRVAGVTTAPGLAGMLLPTYVVMLVLMHTAPFDVITRPKEAAAKWRAGRVNLVPFQSFCLDPMEGLDKALINAAYFLPVGLLLGLGPLRQQPRKVQVVYTVGAGLLVAGSVEVLQLAVFSRNFEATDIFTGLLAVMIGVRASAIIGRTPDHATGRRRKTFMGLAIAVWLAMLINDYWRPLAFSFDASLLAARLRAVEWLPLADCHHGNDFQAVLRLFDKCLLFFVLGALCTLFLGGEHRTHSKVVGGAFAAAAFLEAGQLFLPTRQFGLTDILVGTLGGWLGCCLVTALTRLAAVSGAS
jgi:VanZ family protein